MFIYKRVIYLKETDGTGSLYFPEQLSFTAEALEMFFHRKERPLQELMGALECLLPVVHAKADFSAPLRMGDWIEISLSLLKKGESSFTLRTHISQLSTQKVAGTTEVVFVAVSKKSKEPIPIPKELEYYLDLI